MFCKMIAVLKTISFLCNIKSFLVCYVALVLWQDQLMRSLETSSKFALYTPTYWLLRFTTISGANFLNSVDELDKPLPKAVSCKVIAVLKTFSFLSNIKCLLFMTFFVWYLASVWQGQLMTRLETSTNALYTQRYWLLGLILDGEKNTFL